MCLLDDLIKYKKHKTDQAYSMRRRFYSSFIIKNLHWIYTNPLFDEDSEKKENRSVKRANKKEAEE